MYRRAKERTREQKAMMPGTKMTTGIERFFKPMTYQEGRYIIYQEMIHQYIHFLDANGMVTSSKLDKVIPGEYYREATNLAEGSMNGVIEYTFPTGEKKRLIGLRKGVDGRPII